jgi:hypothetical protein
MIYHITEYIQHAITCYSNRRTVDSRPLLNGWRQVLELQKEKQPLSTLQPEKYVGYEKLNDEAIGITIVSSEPVFRVGKGVPLIAAIPNQQTILS